MSTLNALLMPLTAALDSAIQFIYDLQPIVEPTVILVPDFVHNQVSDLSKFSGLGEDILRYVLGLVMCCPLAMIVNAIPYGHSRHLFSFVLGAFLLQFLLGVQWIHHLISTMVVYVMLLTLPRKTNTVVVPVFAMAYLVLGHLHRQYVNYLGYDFDFTAPQMVLTQKLYMTAYNLYDGECLAMKQENRAAIKCQAFALTKVPSLVEFLGYTFCFSSVLSGPATEFAVYERSITGSLLYTSEGKPKGSIPSNVWPAVQPILASLLAWGVYFGLGAHFPMLDPTDPQHATPVVLTKAFLQHPWWYRYLHMWMGILATRQKYYFAWKSAEAAQNIWYAGFEGFDETGRAIGWDHSSNVDIWQVETAPNFQTLSKAWNKKTSLWLTRYVYIRTGGSLIAVYSMSAFWHGFYPGYYLFFLSVPLLTVCERMARTKISPHFSSARWGWYGILGMLATSLIAEYMAVPFLLLAFDWSWDMWKSHYFFGHIVCMIGYAALTLLPTPKAPVKDKLS